jgi:RHS repeat-associated protein
MQTVSSVTTNDGNGHVATTLYTYAGGYYHIGERDFRGFQKVTVFGPIGPNGEQTITETWFHQGNDTAVDVNNPDALVGYMKGKPYRVRVTDGTGKKLSETTTSYAPDNDAPYFNPPVQVDSFLCEGTTCGKQVRSISTYDSTNGNVLREDLYGDLADPTDDRTVTRTFSPNTTAWILGLPTKETIYQGIGTTNRVAATDYFYDGAPSCKQSSTNQTPTQGNVTRIVRWLADGTSPEVRMAYNAYGNLICTRDANGNTSTVDYDSSATFPIAATNPLGHKTTTQYYGVDGVPADSGLYGQTKSVTDANKATATTQYDVFGRPTLVTAPDGSWTKTSYNSFGAGVGTQHTRTDTSAGLSSWTYFDGLGRTITEKATGPDGKMIVTQTQYDSRGAVARNSLPYFEGGSPAWRAMTYDPLGRVVNATDPDGSRALRCYRDWVTVSIDANNYRRRETRDAAGRVVRVDEYLGSFISCTTDAGTPYATTNYDYDVLGNLLTVSDAKGNVTEMLYDTLNRKRFMHDPDMGDWSYDYDVAGNLVRQEDAKGQVLTFQHDALNRLSKKFLRAGKQIVYRYDSGPKGIGRLAEVEDLSGSTKFTYDVMGRIIKTQKTVLPVVLPGRPTKYLTQSTYDDAGRIASIKYPDNKVIKYAYNGPVLDRVYDLQNVYAAYSGYNALGQPAQMTSGNGVVTNYSYSNAANPDCPEHNFRPCKTKTQGAAGAYQDFRYRYDRGGNILSIDDVINGNQAFQYDELSRLLSATGTYGTITYAYDQIGNLLCNSQISPCTAGSPNYVYPPSGANSIRPHAATRVGTRDFTYDPNGNMLNGSGRTLTYDTENRLVQAATAQGDTNFIYDGNGGRVIKIASVATTTYIGKLYECTDGQCIKYIFAGDQRIARKMVDNNIIHYYHSDHLGSSSAVTDAAGNRVQNLAYFPFGETREQSGTVDVHHKYTGQELDDSTDLYFYGARYYDPVLARFISPDSQVTLAYYPQDLNRYSYTANNPLNYVDPSGHSWFSKNWKKNKWFRIAVVTIGSAALGGVAGAFLAPGLNSIGFAVTIQGVTISASGGAVTGAIAGGVGGFLTQSYMESSSDKSLQNANAFAGSLTPLDRGNGNITEGKPNEIYINGVNTSEEDAVASGQGSTVIYNSSRGLLYDLVEATVMKFTRGTWDKATRVLADEIIERYYALMPGEKLTIRAHSEGDIITSNALYVAHSQIEDRYHRDFHQRIEIRPIGGASWTHPPGFYVNSYINPGDPVAHLFGTGRNPFSIYSLSAHSVERYKRAW